jgi:hypothetical protein
MPVKHIHLVGGHCILEKKINYLSQSERIQQPVIADFTNYFSESAS